MATDAEQPRDVVCVQSRTHPEGVIGPSQHVPGLRVRRGSSVRMIAHPVMPWNFFITSRKFSGVASTALPLRQNI